MPSLWGRVAALFCPHDWQNARRGGLSCGLTCPSTASAENYARHVISAIAKRPSNGRCAGAGCRLPLSKDSDLGASIQCDQRVRLLTRRRVTANTPMACSEPTAGHFCWPRVGSGDTFEATPTGLNKVEGAKQRLQRASKARIVWSLQLLFFAPHGRTSHLRPVHHL